MAYLPPTGRPHSLRKVLLKRKAGGHDAGKLYAMKVLRKAALVQRQDTGAHAHRASSVLELVRQAPSLAAYLRLPD